MEKEITFPLKGKLQSSGFQSLQLSVFAVSAHTDK